MKNSFDLYEKITNDMIESIESEKTLPWQKPWNGGGPRNAISNKPYRGINTFILSLKKYTSPFWLTMDQANKLGGRIKKGEKATYITFWKFLKFDNGVDESGNAKSKNIPMLRYFLVFNVEQCEKLKLPKHCELKTLDFNPIAECEKIVDSYKDAPEIVSEYGNRACYIPMVDKINMPSKESFNTVEGYYATLFHEMGHSARVEKRLDQEKASGGRGFSHRFGDEDYSFEELCAEFTASYLCGISNISHVVANNSAAYLQGWLEVFKKDKKMLIKAAGLAQKRADYIQGIRYEKTVEGGDSQGD